MHVFQIPADNPDLIKLIARDAKLKSFCFKAEGYHILVPKKKFAQFKASIQMSFNNFFTKTKFIHLHLFW